MGEWPPVDFLADCLVRGVGGTFVLEGPWAAGMAEDDTGLLEKDERRLPTLGGAGTFGSCASESLRFLSVVRLAVELELGATPCAVDLCFDVMGAG